MLRDVKHTVTDGLLGFATATGDGKSLKIGVSPIVSDTPIIITGDMDAAKIKARLGLSPLADAVMSSVQFGASRIYCLPVSATTAGKLGSVSKGRRRRGLRHRGRLSDERLLGGRQDHGARRAQLRRLYLLH